MKIKIIANVDIDVLKTVTNVGSGSVDDILSAIRNECHWLDESGFEVDTVEIVEMSEGVEATTDKKAGKEKNNEERR